LVRANSRPMRIWAGIGEFACASSSCFTLTSCSGLPPLAGTRGHRCQQGNTPRTASSACRRATSLRSPPPARAAARRQLLPRPRRVESRRSAVACRTGGAKSARCLSLPRSPRNPSRRFSRWRPEPGRNVGRRTSFLRITPHESEHGYEEGSFNSHWPDTW
jgi:hypothetical protein